jgi:oxygen-independent coproporphyrinogen-3 oxidase
MLAEPPLGLYVHMPWCLAKCPYCDFNSHGLRGELPHERYTAALIRDLERAAGPLRGRELATVFFGGGTPSLFPAESVARVLTAARRLLATDASLEVTLEANPGGMEIGDLASFRDAGVTRISLGVQSFDARALRVLGRIHGPDEARAAARAVSAAGLERLNLDLMYALPGQSAEEAVADVEAAVVLAPEHISQYQLTLEPNTLFHARPPELPDEDSAAAMQEATAEALAAAGYVRYEVSAWARPGAECRHNLNYWRYGDYLGVGAGAHGKITRTEEGRILRTRNFRHPDAYMQAGDPLEELTEVAPRDRVFEFMLNVLRLADGFDTALFESRTGMPAGVLAPALARADDLGLVEACGNAAWRPTLRGLQFLNDLQILFLPEATDS